MSPVIYESVLPVTAEYLHAIHDVTQRCQRAEQGTPIFYGTVQLEEYSTTYRGWVLGARTIDSMHVAGVSPKPALFRTTCLPPS